MPQFRFTGRSPIKFRRPSPHPPNLLNCATAAAARWSSKLQTIGEPSPSRTLIRAIWLAGYFAGWNARSRRIQRASGRPEAPQECPPPSLGREGGGHVV